jgi:hypothetical protein
MLQKINQTKFEHRCSGRYIKLRLSIDAPEDKPRDIFVPCCSVVIALEGYCLSHLFLVYAFCRAVKTIINNLYY